jgi:hypothetical protein
MTLRAGIGWPKARSKVKRDDPRYVQALDRAFDAMEEVE